MMEGFHVNEGVAVLENVCFNQDFERRDLSSPYSNKRIEGAYAEDVVVISGTITIAP